MTQSVSASRQKAQWFVAGRYCRLVSKRMVENAAWNSVIRSGFIGRPLAGISNNVLHPRPLSILSQLRFKFKSHFVFVFLSQQVCAANPDISVPNLLLMQYLIYYISLLYSYINKFAPLIRGLVSAAGTEVC